MSAYISFYVKSPKNDFCPVGTFCRSSKVYQVAQHGVPYEKNVPISGCLIKDWIDEVESDLRSYKEMMETEEQMIREIGTWNNSVEEKEEAIYEHRSSINQIKEDIHDIEWAYWFFCNLLTKVDEAESTKYYTNKDYHIEPDTYVWAGIEAGYPVMGENGNLKEECVD